MSNDNIKNRTLNNTRLNRLWEIGTSMAKATGHLAKEAFSDAIKQNEVSVKENVAKIKAAQEIVKSMGHLKGGLMKIGQMISITEDLLLPKEISTLFKTLQQTAPAMGKNDIDRVFLRNFQKTPNDVFKSFDYSPIASASIGQVHKGETHEGDLVAIKIQYPEIVKAIKADLQNLNQIDTLFSLLIPGKPQIRPMLEELKLTLLDECDYDKEAREQEFFRSQLQIEFSDKIKIPKVFKNYSTMEILTSEWVHGSSYEDTLHWTQEERNQLGEIAYNSFLYSFFKLGCLHADPQNGNYLFNKNQIVMMDFGSVKYFSPEFKTYYPGILLSVEKNNFNLFKVCALNLNMIRETDPTEYIEKQFTLVKNIYHPFLNDGVYPINDLNPFHLIKEFFRDLEISGKKAPHPDFLLMDRANIGLFTKIKFWKSHIDWKLGRVKFREPYLKNVLDEIDLKYPELGLK